MKNFYIKIKNDKRVWSKIFLDIVVKVASEFDG
jgi:hypothetical protein